MSLYAKIKMKNELDTFVISDIQGGLAHLFEDYITNQLQESIRLNHEYQLNPIDVCAFTQENHPAILNDNGEADFLPTDSLFYQDFYFFENKNPEQELQDFQNNRYFLTLSIDTSSTLSVIFS